jgi:hypothetical protein
MGKTLTTNQFIERAKGIHNDKYDYSLVEYRNAKTKIKILCYKHGVFEQVPDSHITQKTGCPLCSKKHKYTDHEFIDKAILIHGKIYDYSEVKYKNNYTKIKIKCKTHGFFEQTPSNHLSGKGCDLCQNSKNENLISLILKNNNVNYIQQHKFDDCRHIRRLPFDFYIPDHNMCIEFQGKQHYHPVEFFGGKNGFILQQKRDKIKELFCKKNSIKLILIKYNDNVSNIISKLFD